MQWSYDGVLIAGDAVWKVVACESQNMDTMSTTSS